MNNVHTVRLNDYQLKFIADAIDNYNGQAMSFRKHDMTDDNLNLLSTMCRQTIGDTSDNIHGFTL